MAVSLGPYLTDRQQRVFNDILPTMQGSGLEDEYLGALVVDFPTTGKDQLSTPGNNLTQREAWPTMDRYGTSGRNAI